MCRPEWGLNVDRRKAPTGFTLPLAEDFPSEGPAAATGRPVMGHEGRSPSTTGSAG